MAIPLRTTVFWAIYRRLEYMPPMQQPPERVRRASDLRNRTLALPPSKYIAGAADPRAAITDTVAVLPDGARIPLRIYRPRDAGPGPLPVVMNFHGGGWVSGNIRQSEWWASSVAAQAGVAVVSVEYRLAPEFPYPIPVEDCYAATVWVTEHAEDLDLDAGRLAVMGDSAGGNIAAVVCLMSRDRGGPPISLQILIYPATDFLSDFPSKHENAAAPILCREDIDNAQSLYFHNSAGDRSEPYASPLRADHTGLPPALIQTAEHDPIRDEGRAYADALRKAGVPFRYTNYVDAVHGYVSLPTLVPASRQALAEVVGAVRDSLGR